MVLLLTVDRAYLVCDCRRPDGRTMRQSQTLACWRAVFLAGEQIVGLSHLRFAAGVCVLAAGLLMGGAGGAVAVADPDSSGSTTASSDATSPKKEPGGTHTKDATRGSGQQSGQQPSTGATTSGTGATTTTSGTDATTSGTTGATSPKKEPGGTHTKDATRGSGQQSGQQPSTGVTTSGTGAHHNHIGTGATSGRRSGQQPPPARQPHQEPAHAPQDETQRLGNRRHHLRNRRQPPIGNRRHHLRNRRRPPPRQEPAPPLRSAPAHHCGRATTTTQEPAPLRSRRPPIWSRQLMSSRRFSTCSLRLPVRSSRSRNCSPTFTPSCWALTSAR